MAPSQELAVAAAVGAVVGGIGCFLLTRGRKGPLNVRSTAASGSTVYESSRAVDEYLQFHFASANELAPLVGKFLAKEVLQFPALCARECAASAPRKGRCLDIGCAVGGAVFEMARDFQEVVGFDFSAAFIDAANEMKKKGSRKYERLVEGEIMEQLEAKVPSGLDRGRCRFIVGDACDMPALKLGKFDSVLAANLMCRVPDPNKFLRDMKDVVSEGGTFVLVSPFSWLPEYTDKKKWVGGYRDSRGQAVMTEGQVANALGPYFRLVETKQMPFIIREHQRKNQVGVSCCQIWKRTSQV